MTALLDGIEAGQRAKLKAEANRKAELDARLRPRIQHVTLGATSWKRRSSA